VPRQIWGATVRAISGREWAEGEGKDGDKGEDGVAKVASLGSAGNGELGAEKRLFLW